MKPLRELTMFGFVGGLATSVHVAVAYILLTQTAINPYLGNAVGACCAMAVSFLGNARLTFFYRGRMTAAFLRFLTQAGLSFGLTTIILHFVESANYPVWAYAVMVVLLVPPISFLLAKLWVFRMPDEDAKITTK